VADCGREHLAPPSLARAKEPARRLTKREGSERPPPASEGRHAVDGSGPDETEPDETDGNRPPAARRAPRAACRVWLPRLPSALSEDDESEDEASAPARPSAPRPPAGVLAKRRDRAIPAGIGSLAARALLVGIGSLAPPCSTPLVPPPGIAGSARERRERKVPPCDISFAVPPGIAGSARDRRERKARPVEAEGRGVAVALAVPRGGAETACPANAPSELAPWVNPASSGLAPAVSLELE